MSEPTSLNAHLWMGSGLWKDVTITRVTVPAAGTTPLPATNMPNRSGMWIWVPGTGASMRWGESGDTFDASTPLAYAGAITPIPVTDQVSIVGQSASGTLTVTVLEYVV